MAPWTCCRQCHAQFADDRRKTHNPKDKGRCQRWCCVSSCGVSAHLRPASQSCRSSDPDLFPQHSRCPGMSACHHSSSWHHSSTRATVRSHSSSSSAQTAVAADDRNWAFAHAEPAASHAATNHTPCTGVSCTLVQRIVPCAAQLPQVPRLNLTARLCAATTRHGASPLPE